MESIKRLVLLFIVVVIFQGLKAQSSDSVKSSAQAYRKKAEADASYLNKNDAAYRGPKADLYPVNGTTPDRRPDIAPLQGVRNPNPQPAAKKGDIAPLITTPNADAIPADKKKN